MIARGVIKRNNVNRKTVNVLRRIFMNIFLKWIIYALAVMLVAWLVPGISVDGFWSAMIAMVIIALINAIIRPLILLITLPINFLTLGIFTFVINALLLLLAGYVTPGFSVDGFWSALIGSLLLSLISIPINSIDGKRDI